MLVANRAEAGRVLAARLSAYANRGDVIVLALPRGGVPVGFEVARILAAPLDVFVVRKLGVPGYEELAMGAIATGGVRFLNMDMITVLGLSDEVVEATTARELRELERRERRYRGERTRPAVRGQAVIMVEDGPARDTTISAGLWGFL